MIRAKAPGKLFISGEYAVVNHGYPAVLVAVDRFITVSVEPCEHEGTIISRQYAHLPLKWKRVGHRLVIEKRDNPFHYILEAIAILEQYARELGRRLMVFKLQVDSDLDSEEGAKYGLGSSAAVTIATIRALCRLYEIEEDDLTIYKLAALAHLKLGSNGSFGDLAASAFTGWIAYQCFDRKFVLEQKASHSLPELVAMDWPSLMIRKLTPPTEYDLLIAWTKRPASTPSLVDEVRTEVDPDAYRSFLFASKDLVCQMIEAFDNDNGPAICSLLEANRGLLRSLYPSIETEELTRLIELAAPYGTAKTSGAGGGDCGIVLTNKSIDIGPLIDSWRNADIIRLDIRVYDKADDTGHV